MERFDAEHKLHAGVVAGSSTLAFAQNLEGAAIGAAGAIAGGPGPRLR